MPLVLDAYNCAVFEILMKASKHAALVGSKVEEAEPFIELNKDSSKVSQLYVMELTVIWLMTSNA